MGVFCLAVLKYEKKTKIFLLYIIDNQYNNKILKNI